MDELQRERLASDEGAGKRLAESTPMASESEPQVVIHELAGGVRLVELWGEHDLRSARTVRQAVSGAPALIMELSAATFIDSSIVGVVISAATDATGVIVSPPGRPPRRVLDSVRAGDLVPVVDDRVSALSIFGLGDPEDAA